MAAGRFWGSIVDAQRQRLCSRSQNTLPVTTPCEWALSPSLAADLIALGEPLPANVTDATRADEFIFRLSELSPSAHSAHLASWDATRHDSFDWIGPREVNLNYYPWWGAQTMTIAIILNMGAAERMGVVSELSHRTLQVP
jgi:hypothetical protein